MKCVFCNKGETRPGSAGFIAKSPDSDPVVKDVPTQVCDNCGQEYWNSDTLLDLLEKSAGNPDSDVRIEMPRIIITYDG